MLTDLIRKGVIKTFLIDIPVIMLFGALFSLFTRNEGGRLSVFSSRYFWHGLVFTTIFNGAVIYAIIKFPDWMWMYFLEDSTNSLIELIYIFIFLYYIPYILGFYLGHLLIVKSKAWWLGLSLFLLGWEAWVVLHLFDRYSVVGTREQFLNGTAVSLFSPENPVGLAMNLSVGLMVVYFIGVWWFYRKRKKEYVDSEY